MLTLQDKRDFASAAMRPLAEFTLPFLTQVLGVVNPVTGESLGTGFFCMLAGEQAVVTAAHGLRRARESGRYKSLAFTRGPGERPMIVAGKIVYADRFDLAVYLPDGPFPSGDRKAFWPEDRIDRDTGSLTRDYLFVQGFPRIPNTSSSLGDGATTPEPIACGAMVRYRAESLRRDERDRLDREEPGYPYLPEGYLQPHQFAINFDPGGAGAPVEDVGAWLDGLSGSPVWRVGAAGGNLGEWKADRSRLVGVVTKWDEDYRVLVATQAARAIEVVAEA